MSPRAGHDPERIKHLHGSLFDVKCSSPLCDYKESNNFTDPIVPALAIPRDESEPALPQNPSASFEAARASLTQKPSAKPKELNIADENVKLAELPDQELPTCPKCQHLLRPGVVWFGEQLPKDVIDDVEEFIETPSQIDLMIVIGTSAAVYPAAGYIWQAKAKGARVAVINMDPDTGKALDSNDWFFEGDASTILPALFEKEIGTFDKVDV